MKTRTHRLTFAAIIVADLVVLVLIGIVLHWAAQRTSVATTAVVVLCLTYMMWVTCTRIIKATDDATTPLLTFTPEEHNENGDLVIPEHWHADYR